MPTISEITYLTTMKTDKLLQTIFLSQPSFIHELIPSIPPDCQYNCKEAVIRKKEYRLEGLLVPAFDLAPISLEAPMKTDKLFYTIFLSFSTFPDS